MRGLRATLTLACLLLVSPVGRGELAAHGHPDGSGRAAQQAEEELSLSIRKDFGYRAGDQLQGSFTLEAYGPPDLQRVDFLLDGEVIGSADAPPFRFSFSTSQFSLGRHSLAAQGQTREGRALSSPAHSVEFISAEQGWQSAMDLAIPLVLGVTALAVIGTVVPGWLGGRRRSFRLGHYGPAGGAICPGCGLPYARQILAPNLLVGKLARCPHCGKWALARRAGPQALAAGEARYRKAQLGELPHAEDERQRLERLLNDSKYLD